MSASVHLGFDHAGFELAEELLRVLPVAGYAVISHGPRSYDADDDYAPFCIAAAEAVASDRDRGDGSLGIVIGGSGNGEQIAANRVRGIRAALVWNAETALLARQHNDANVIAIGARQHTLEDSMSLVLAFLAEPFSGEERHARRISQMSDYEQLRRAR